MATAKTIAAARGIIISLAQHHARVEQCLDELSKLKGMSFADFESCRGEFISAYCEARGVTADDKTANAAARKSWGRIMARLGIEKPASESAAATAKRAQRAAKAPAKPAAEKAPAKGEAKASAIKQELSAIEAHLVSLFRRGRFADVIELVHSEAAKASPM